MLYFLESNCTVGKKLSHPLLLEKENKSCKQAAGVFGIAITQTFRINES